MKKLFPKLALATALAGALFVGIDQAETAQCPRDGWACPDVYNPVICSDGQVYSNSCVAWVYCATGCQPYGDI